MLLEHLLDSTNVTKMKKRN